MYKIAFTDIDGTLLGPDRTLTSATIAAVRRIKDEIPFILVSSRMPRQMYHLQKDLQGQDLPLIAYNGGYISRQKKGLFSVEIPMEILEKIVAYNEKDPQYKVHLSLDRKSTRLNSSHVKISYAVFCLKKKMIYWLFSIANSK